MANNKLDLTKLDLDKLFTSFTKDTNGNWVFLPNPGREDPHFHSDFHRKLTFNGVKPFPYKARTGNSYQDLTTAVEKKECILPILDSMGMGQHYELLKNNYSQSLLQISHKKIANTFENLNESNDLTLKPKKSTGNFFLFDGEVYLDVIEPNFKIEIPFKSSTVVNVSLSWRFKLTANGTILESLHCEAPREEDIESFQALLHGDLPAARPFYNNVNQQLALQAVQSADTLNHAKERLQEYLNLMDSSDAKVVAAKKVLTDIKDVKPSQKEHPKYVKIIKTTASLVSGNQNKIGSYIRQAKEVHSSHRLRHSMLMLAGLALIGLSVTLAIVSHGAAAPLSVLGVKLGVTLITGLVHAKAGLGLITTVSSVGLFARSMNKPTNLLQENMNTLARASL